jgi:hypothetical protein
MKRRDFLRSAGFVSASLALPRAGRLLSQGAAADVWRTFEVTTTVQVLKTSGMTRIWLPTALVNPTPYQQTLANEFKAEVAPRRWSRAGPTRSESSQRNSLSA